MFGRIREFDLEDRLPGEDAVGAYENDGVVCLRKAFGREWLAVVEEGIEAALSHASEDIDYVTKAGDKGRFSASSQAWPRVAPFRRFIFESRAPDLAWPFLRSETLTLFYDFLLVKEAGSSQARTPWHQDQAYFPLHGTNVINCWMALDLIPLETALRFWCGSHRDGIVYQAVDFTEEADYRHLRRDRPPPPDIDGAPDLEIIATEMEPGDMLVWNSLTFHSAPGNTLDRRRAAFSLNWVGDGVTFHDVPSLKTYRSPEISEGMPISCEKFPIVRRR